MHAMSIFGYCTAIAMHVILVTNNFFVCRRKLIMILANNIFRNIKFAIFKVFIQWKNPAMLL